LQGALQKYLDAIRLVRHLRAAHQNAASVLYRLRGGSTIARSYNEAVRLGPEPETVIVKRRID